MRQLILIIFLSVVISQAANAQGCVAIRSTGASSTMQMPHHDQSKWQFNANYRYFKSFRHFKGKEEQEERVEQGTDVRNFSNALDISLIRQFTNRFSMAVNLPLLANRRSSLYEHGLVNGVYVKKERHSTSSYGVGDMRLSAYYWLLDPMKSMKGNIQLGVGIKFATGDYNYKDYWWNVGPNGTKELRTVDQSIQLGDGGTGFTVEMNSYYSFTPALSIYANGFYLINPRDVNGTRTYRETLSPALANEDIMSVPDQYMARAGFNYMKGRWGFTGGMRLDGIPVYDLVGQSNAFRRPGYVIAVEPGISYQKGKNFFYLNVPVALVRNRTQSVTDKEMTEQSGSYRHGDAAFADYVINLGYSVKF
ncbi:MAG TPA: hypothetical protein VLC28_09875 [Flavitalea sp.]|nr:hypothetical protein [Flavitalea sp.]